jgi:hypothetical protein
MSQVEQALIGILNEESEQDPSYPPLQTEFEYPDLDEERALRRMSRMRPPKVPLVKIDYAQRAQQARFDQEGQELVVKAKLAHSELARIIDELEFRGESFRKYQTLQNDLLDGWINNPTKLISLLEQWNQIRSNPKVIDLLLDQNNRTKKKLFFQPNDDEPEYIDIDESDQLDELTAKFAAIKDINDPEYEALMVQVKDINSKFAQLTWLLDITGKTNEYRDMFTFPSAIKDAIKNDNVYDIRNLINQWNSKYKNIENEFI